MSSSTPFRKEVEGRSTFVAKGESKSAIKKRSATYTKHPVDLTSVSSSSQDVSNVRQYYPGPRCEGLIAVDPVTVVSAHFIAQSAKSFMQYGYQGHDEPQNISFINLKGDKN